MNKPSSDIFRGEVRSQEYLQVCFPGAVGADKGQKVLEMIGGNEGVERAMRYCKIDSVSSLQLHLGPTTTGSTLHGTVLPTKGLWLRAKIKRKKESDHAVEEKYISDVEVRGVIKAHATFQDPADLCCYPVSNASKFDPNALFHDKSIVEPMSKFVPVLKAPKTAKRTSSHTSTALNMPSVPESHTTDLKAQTMQQTELYLPPPLFFPETKQGFTSWLNYMMTDSQKNRPDRGKQPVHDLSKKMRYFELNMNSNEIKIKPRIEEYETDRILPVNNSSVGLVSVSQYGKEHESLKHRASPLPSLSTRKITIFDREKSDGVLIIPVVPPSRMISKDERITQRIERWVEILRYLFDIRPIWSMGSLITTVGGNTEAVAKFRHVVGCVAYRITGATAYTKLWVRIGYNPFSHSKAKSGVEEMKAVSLLQQLVFNIPRDMRRELRRKFPSFGHHGHYLPSGFRRVPYMADDMKLRTIIKSKRSENAPSFTQNLEEISADSVVDIGRCKQTVEELFDELLLSGSFSRTFCPEDLISERIHTVIKSQIPARTDKVLGLIFLHTRQTVQSILADEFGSYWRSKFPSASVSVEQEFFLTEESDDTPTVAESSDQSEMSDNEIRSSDSCYNISDEDGLST